MKVLVTGGGGFIGSHVVEALLDIGHDVRVVDRDPAWVVGGAELIQADLGAAGVAAEAVDGMEAICHQAARVGLGVDFADAPGYVADNQLATAHLLAALSAVKFTGRLVLASSMVVYGEGRYGCPSHGSVSPGPRLAADLDAGRFDPACPVCAAPLSWAAIEESAPLDPRSVYASSKVGQEHLCASWARETGSKTGASVVALRYHNVYGPRLPFGTPYAGVAALWLTALRRGEAPRVFEDGRQTRDFVHVTDVAAANLAALDVPLMGGSFEAVNVCSGAPVSILEVAAGLTNVFGPDGSRPVVTGEYRLSDVRHVVASPDRAGQLLGFRARVPLEEGLAAMARRSERGESPDVAARWP
jgi:dTDP-L-rhamnose 4-epimerase